MNENLVTIFSLIDNLGINVNPLNILHLKDLIIQNENDNIIYVYITLNNIKKYIHNNTIDELIY